MTMKKVVFILVAMLASASAMAQSKDDVRDTVVTDTTVWKSLELEGVVVKSHAVKVKVQGDSQREPGRGHEAPLRRAPKREPIQG